MATGDDSTMPLLPQNNNSTGERRRNSNVRSSWRSGSRSSFASPRLRRSSTRDVHPRHDEVEPVLPATAVPAEQETRLHNTNWALSDEEPNTWAQIRHNWREEFAEFFGTFMILIFGPAVEAQVALHNRPASSSHDFTYGDYLQCRFTWAVGVAMAVWVAGGVSGGHCNPTITIVLALFRGFPARKVPSFIISQVLGATLATFLVYANYTHSISLYEGGDDVRTVVGPHATAGLFFTLPAAGLPYLSAFYTEFLASAILVMIVFAVSDKANLAPPRGTMPFALFLALLGIGSALGVNTGYAINGARDTGPRIALSLIGYGKDVWLHDRLYWLWAPWGASICGGTVGGFVYDAFLYTGRDSPLNRPRSGGKSNDDYI
ncbi:hypothetical protein KC315_g12741 [Hortaea werneckii]|nr:hypothetical protein KC315_g12741 [Hortaea werneckii]